MTRVLASRPPVQSVSIKLRTAILLIVLQLTPIVIPGEWDQLNRLDFVCGHLPPAKHRRGC